MLSHPNHPWSKLSTPMVNVGTTLLTYCLHVRHRLETTQSLLTQVKAGCSRSYTSYYKNRNLSTCFNFTPQAFICGIWFWFLNVHILKKDCAVVLFSFHLPLCPWLTYWCEQYFAIWSNLFIQCVVTGICCSAVDFHILNILLHLFWFYVYKLYKGKLITLQCVPM